MTCHLHSRAAACAAVQSPVPFGGTARESGARFHRDTQNSPRATGRCFHARVGETEQHGVELARCCTCARVGGTSSTCVRSAGSTPDWQTHMHVRSGSMSLSRASPCSRSRHSPASRVRACQHGGRASADGTSDLR